VTTRCAGRYRRVQPSRGSRIAPGTFEPATGALLDADTLVLGTDVIHSVANPDRRHFTGSIHVYGSDFFNQPRSLWDIETMLEESATGQRMRALFDDNANMDRSEGDD
jgi:predicted metal-dependent enzyme (double-stranded beta helix superfamily)